MALNTYLTSANPACALRALADDLFHPLQQVHILGALPLRNLSRLWGWLNSFQLPVWLRPISFKTYAFLFGCDLTEIEPADLREYPSLGAFFYRSLAPGTRPIADAALVSPADGTVLHFGAVQGARVEQVKGLTYSLDALLGVERRTGGVPNGNNSMTVPFPDREMAIVDDREFANVNGIEYSLSQLIGASAPTTPLSPTSGGEEEEAAPPEFPTDPAAYGRPSPPPLPQKYGVRFDASVLEPDKSVQETVDASVAKELGPPERSRLAGSAGMPRRGSVRVKPGNALFFTVIYLAPGDYHRFHSPTAWVVEKRRHFQGTVPFPVYGSRASSFGPSWAAADAKIWEQVSCFRYRLGSPSERRICSC